MRLAVCVLLSIAMTGCAGHRGFEAAPQSKPAPSQPAPGSVADAHPPAETLEAFMAKVRKLSAEARPGRPVQAASIESTDPELGAAIVAATGAPAPETYRAVARQYHRVGVFDGEYEYLARALALAPHDPATFDALARLWRDSGLPQLGLGDAHRAVYYAPQSAVARNTLGTILQALGQHDLARAEYERALRIDRFASYALNNLCYDLMLEGQPVKAAEACRHALVIDPGLRAAHNNLALALASAGNTSAARDAFAAMGDTASTLYNVGMVHLARHEYKSAIEAFVAAHTARPTMAAAMVRARQAAAQPGATSEE